MGERGEIMQLMDEMEALVLKKGWPVPFTPFYLVNHERMLSLMDQLRASLQDELDSRFIKAFAPDANTPSGDAEKNVHKKSKGKERSH
jgi:hypothetical protein